MSKANRNKQKKNKPRPISNSPEYKNFIPGPGQKKRLYGLSKTAREKWDREECDRIIKYLRVRRLVDGTRIWAPDMEYTSPFIRQVIKTILKIGFGNYIGVMVNRSKMMEGMCGDSIYSEFFYEYHSRPSLTDWLKTPTQWEKLIDKYAKCYNQRGSHYRSESHADTVRYYPKIYKTRMEHNPSHEEAYDNYKDHIYLLNQRTYERRFKWTKKSHKQTKKEKKAKSEREISKTRQSLLALASLTKYNVLIDDRWNLSAMCNTKDEESRDHIFVWDHVLQREHIYQRLGSNKMSDPKSMWFGAMNGIDHIKHFQNKVYSDRKSTVPTLPNFRLNELYDAYSYYNNRHGIETEYEVDVSKGGYISGGAHNRDSVYAWDGDDHIVIMKGEYVLTTASVTYLFGNGDNYFGAQVLSLMMHWGHAMKHLHQIQSGKHYAEEPKVDEDEEE
ncbi:MAG: hypothetical protein ACJZ41_02115 [Candidatus Pelagibacterales bacterium]|jgi:hypothetical protein|tara:strand:+ start:1401 stop:2735 length:1335 start_codon:yes stop_codon:yes gene_type:complete